MIDFKTVATSTPTASCPQCGSEHCTCTTTDTLFVPRPHLRIAAANYTLRCANCGHEFQVERTFGDETEEGPRQLR